MKDQNAKRRRFILIHVLNLLVVVWSLGIYVSVYEWCPWHEGSGMQLVAVFITSAPAFLVLGVMLLILGRTITIPLSNRLIPFVAMAIFVLPIVVEGSDTSIFVGTIIGAAFVPFVLFSTISAYANMATEK